MARRNTTLGIFFMLVFCAFAPVMDASAKATPVEVPVTQILAFRFGIQVLLLYPLVMALSLPSRTTGREVVFHLARAATLTLATYCFFTALRYMPVADAIAIFFVSPFIVTLLGALFLKEPIGWRRSLASLVGFGGALLVIRPSFADLGVVALLPLATALMFAIYMLLTRAMSQRAHPLVLQAHTALAASLMTIPPMLLLDGTGLTYFDPVWPSPYAWMTLIAVGTVATISHVFLTFALRLIPAGTVASLQYFEIVGATIVGFLIFGDFPTPLTFLGIAIIIASGLYNIARESRLSEIPERAAPPPP
ncbi:EamA family transporter [Sagittula sp. P11]|uniref:DMT family transporter n=1 Tax=Sagittula sp. P11 TaxID=2009329 RepID=UPI000C2D6631|nr:DMT family transporter [Sagittula sp. P11]AUC54745.1 EamA family transporter [Sagittula sp. P11]